MPWYEMNFTRAGIEHGEHKKLIRSAQTIWDAYGKPADFALFGKHEVKIPNDILTVYYLSPEGHKYCSDGVLIGWQPNVPNEKPEREGLNVVVGDDGALHLLD